MTQHLLDRKTCANGEVKRDEGEVIEWMDDELNLWNSSSVTDFFLDAKQT